MNLALKVLIGYCWGCGLQCWLSGSSTRTGKVHLLEHFYVMTSMFLSFLASGEFGIKYVAHLQQLCRIRYLWLILLSYDCFHFALISLSFYFSSHYMFYTKSRKTDNWSNRDISMQREQILKYLRLRLPTERKDRTTCKCIKSVSIQITITNSIVLDVH